MAVRNRALSNPVWGDGFVNDGLDSMARVTDWRSCAVDEYIRIFPRLLTSDNVFPAILRDHLVTCITVRAWRLQRSDAGGTESGQPPISVRPTEVMRRGASRHEDWFKEPGRHWSTFLMPRPLDTAALAAERADLAFVDGLLRELNVDKRRAFHPATACRFAFCTGIHPAYLWPEALLQHELFGSAGWLGFLCRGRSAFMPEDMARYFSDSIRTKPDGSIVVREPSIGRILSSPMIAGAILDVARRTLAGRRPVATWPRTANRAILFDDIWPRSARRCRVLPAPA